MKPLKSVLFRYVILVALFMGSIFMNFAVLEATKVFPGSIGISLLKSSVAIGEEGENWEQDYYFSYGSCFAYANCGGLCCEYICDATAYWGICPAGEVNNCVEEGLIDIVCDDSFPQYDCENNGIVSSSYCN